MECGFALKGFSGTICWPILRVDHSCFIDGRPTLATPMMPKGAAAVVGVCAVPEPH